MMEAAAAVPEIMNNKFVISLLAASLNKELKKQTCQKSRSGQSLHFIVLRSKYIL
jgi:hypothetical protein